MGEKRELIVYFSIHLSQKRKPKDWKNLTTKTRLKILYSMISSISFSLFFSLFFLDTYPTPSFRSLAKAELQQEAQNKERRAEYKKVQKKLHSRRSKLYNAIFSSVCPLPSPHFFFMSLFTYMHLPYFYVGGET